MSIMNNIFKEKQDQFFIVYLEDILIYSDTLHNHRNHMEIVLEKLGRNQNVQMRFCSTRSVVSPKQIQHEVCLLSRPNWIQFRPGLEQEVEPMSNHSSDSSTTKEHSTATISPLQNHSLNLRKTSLFNGTTLPRSPSRI